MRGLISRCLITACCIAGLSAATALSDSVPESGHSNEPSPRRMVVREWRTSQPSFATILGAVAEPATYELPVESISVADLIDRAGGLADAGSLFRVDRAPQSIHSSLRAPSAEAVRPGDVIVVMRPAGAVVSSSFKIAIVGLVAVPAIAEIDANQSSLQAMLQQFDLPAETLSKARTRLTVGPIRTGEVSLQPDAVIVIDRSFVTKSLPIAAAHILSPPRMLEPPAAMISTEAQKPVLGHSVAPKNIEPQADLAPQTLPELPTLEPQTDSAAEKNIEEPAPEPPMTVPAPPALSGRMPVTPAGFLKSLPTVPRQPRPIIAQVRPPIPKSHPPLFFVVLIPCLFGAAAIIVWRSWRIREHVVAVTITPRLPVEEEPIELPSQKVVFENSKNVNAAPGKSRQSGGVLERALLAVDRTQPH